MLNAREEVWGPTKMTGPIYGFEDVIGIEIIGKETKNFREQQQ